MAGWRVTAKLPTLRPGLEAARVERSLVGSSVEVSRRGRTLVVAGVDRGEVEWARQTIEALTAGNVALTEVQPDGAEDWVERAEVGAAGDRAENGEWSTKSL